MINEPQNPASLDSMSDEILDDPTLIDPDEDQENTQFTSTEEIQRAILSGMLHTQELMSYSLSRVEPTSFTERAHNLICRIAQDHFRKYGNTPPQKEFKAIIANEIKRTNGDDKAFTHYLAELNVLCDYVSELFPLEYLKEEMNTHRVRAEYAKIIKRGLEEALKPTSTTESIVEMAAKGVRHLQSFQDNQDRQALFVDELDELGEQDWLIEGHLYQECFYTVFGPSGGGKSFYLIDQAMCIATGKPYLGKWPVRQGKVAYVVSEGRHGIKRRIEAWCQHYGLEPTRNIVVIPSAFDLMNTGEAEELMRLIREKLGDSPDLLVIDTLSRNIGQGDDRSNDLNVFISNVDYLKKQLQCSVCPVHHTGHSEVKRPRGAKNLIDASDIMIRVSPENPDDVAHNWVSHIHQFKSKEDEGLQDYTLKKQIVELDGKTSCVWVELSEEDWNTEADGSKAESDEAMLLELIPVIGIDEEVTEENTITHNQLKEQTGIGKNRITSALKRLITGQMIGVKQGKANEPKRYYRHRWG